MNKQRIIAIVTDSIEFGCSLAYSLKMRGYTAVPQIENESVLFEIIKKGIYDFIVIYDDISKINIIEFIKRCSSFAHKPFFIVMADRYNMKTERQLKSFNNTFYLSMPFDSEIIIEIIEAASLQESRNI